MRTPAAAPRRVLMTADAVGGVWQYALQLAGELAGSGTETVLAVLGPPPSPYQRAEALDISGLRLMADGGRLEWMPGSEDDVERSGDWLLALEARFQPDVVHLNGFCHGALPWRSPVMVVAHSCVRSWWLACRGCQPPPEWDGYIARTTAGLRGADMVVAPTQAFLDEVVRLYGAPPRRQAILNGRAASALARRTKQPFALAAGRFWDEAKNLRVLEAAAERSIWPIRIAGEMRSPVDGGGPVPVAVECLGHLPQGTLARRLDEASAFVNPALYEPFGLGVLEAAHAGCALVLGDIPTLRELWDGAAVFVDPHAADEIAAQLDALAVDPSLCVTLGARARQRAAYYQPGRMADAYRRAYSELLRGTARRVPLSLEPSTISVAQLTRREV